MVKIPVEILERKRYNVQDSIEQCQRRRKEIGCLQTDIAIPRHDKEVHHEKEH